MTEALNALSMDERIRRAQQRVRSDLIVFAKTCLKVINKEGKLVPLVFNPSQLKLHYAIEDQLARTGMVRMLVPKSRRAGISTYVAARFYWKTALHSHKKTLIFSHTQPSSAALFEMVENYQKYNPFKPHTSTANTSELLFDVLDSKYIVATAGAADYGRGMGFQLFHGSEVSRWPFATKHFAGAVQTVSDVPGTEIILESTGAGPNGEFYSRTMKGLKKIGDFEVCFLPWMLDPDCERDVPENFTLNTDKEYGSDMSEAEYAELYSLTPRQAAFAHFKRHSTGSEMMFRQEFPACIADVFIASEQGAYHNPVAILRARKNPDRKGEGPLIMGVDPAGEGGDRFCIAFRRGHVVEDVLSRVKVDSEEGVAWVKDLIDTRKPDAVFIDAGGIGRPIISRLRGLDAKYLKLIKAVNFGGQSWKKMANPKAPGPINRRAEMQERLKEWLEQTDLQVSIPDSDSLQADLMSMLRKPNNNNDLQFVSKDEMRAKKLLSPDEGDAVGLTFAATVYAPDWKKTKPVPKSGLFEHTKAPSSKRGWMAG